MSEFERMNKPREIEELLDTYGWRRLGYLLVQAVRNTPVTPNVLSLAAILAAVACGWAYYHRSLTGALVGLLFMVLHSVFDAADGQLARATGRGSRHGRTIDGIADNISFIAIYVAILWSYVAHHGLWTPWVTLAAVVAGASHAIQCSLVEFERQLFWYYCYGGDLPEREQPESLRASLAEARGIDRVIIALQLNYSLQQRTLLPTSDRLQRTYQRAVAKDPPLRTDFVQRFRDLNTTLVGRWALMAPNSHKLAIMATAFVPFVITSGPLHHLGQASFFLYDILLNVPLVALILEQRSVDRKLTDWLAAYVHESPSTTAAGGAAIEHS